MGKPRANKIKDVNIGHRTPKRVINAPVAALIVKMTMDALRRTVRGLFPPPSVESACDEDLYRILNESLSGAA